MKSGGGGRSSRHPALFASSAFIIVLCVPQVLLFKCLSGMARAGSPFSWFEEATGLAQLSACTCLNSSRKRRSMGFNEKEKLQKNLELGLGVEKAVGFFRRVEIVLLGVGC